MTPEQARSTTRVAILGAGPAGLGAAFQLSRQGLAQATVLEQRTEAGGNAGSFELEGLHVDYGSHRLHPACDPEILRDLQALLGDDLLLRPRHGRIRLRSRWIHFPLKPIDLVAHLPKTFAIGVGLDAMRNFFPHRSGDPQTFASVLQRALGTTICRDFYFPYARKLWGLAPEELSPTQARRRVSANSLSRMIRKVAAAVPGLKPAGAGKFYYPRSGYGQISDALCQAAKAKGADFIFGARVTAIELQENKVRGVRYEVDGREEFLPSSLVWSTLPITLLARSIKPEPPATVLNAASQISFRSMILIYLVLEQEQFTEYDAHYFPEESIPISRLSEPKNYSCVPEPRDLTILCAELPTHPESREWGMSDGELGCSLCGWLEKAGLPVRAKVRRTVTRRLKQAYPIYRAGYEGNFEAVDSWLGGVHGLLTFGRQGLFAHDNTHHALYMAYAASNCLKSSGEFDSTRWAEFRRVFETHVVED
jgi:protoporphyrinogen oxidase